MREVHPRAHREKIGGRGDESRRTLDGLYIAYALGYADNKTAAHVRAAVLIRFPYLAPRFLCLFRAVPCFSRNAHT